MFRLFHLPYDSVAYAGRGRADLVDRCLNRAGRVRYVVILVLKGFGFCTFDFIMSCHIFVSQFIFDVVHLLKDYKADGESSSRLAMEAELSGMKSEKGRLEKLCLDLEARSSELSKTNLAFSTWVYFLLII